MIYEEIYIESDAIIRQKRIKKFTIYERCLKPIIIDVRNNSRTTEKQQVVAQLTLYFTAEKSELKYTDYLINVVWENYCCLL